MVVAERHGAPRSLTIGALVDGTEALAAGLAAAGAGPDRPIVAWLPNRLEWVPLIVAAARLGAPIVGLNTRYRADELRHALDRSAAAVLVAVDEFAGVRFGPIAAAAGAGSLAAVVVVGDGRRSGVGRRSARRVVALGRAADERCGRRTPAPATTC